MGFKDLRQLAYGHIPLISICKLLFISPLHLYLIRIHMGHIQGLCSDSFQSRIFTQNIRRISCIRKPLLFSSCAAQLQVFEPSWEPHRQPQCFLSNLPICWAHLSVGPSKTWLTDFIPSQTFHVTYFLFLFKSSSKKRSKPVNLVLIHSFTNLSEFPVCDTSKDFSLLAARVIIGAGYLWGSPVFPSVSFKGNSVRFWLTSFSSQGFHFLFGIDFLPCAFLLPSTLYSGLLVFPLRRLISRSLTGAKQLSFIRPKTQYRPSQVQYKAART